MNTHAFDFKELSIDYVERDPNQPRKDFGTEGDENRLLVSIQNYGIEEPLKVSEVAPNRYIIIDGHRRYICSKKLGLSTVPCRIYPKLEEGELETRRYEMQNNRRPWRPLERSEALERIKNAKGFHTNHELADYLHLSKTMVSMALNLRKQKLDYISFMEKYDLPESYRYELVILLPKIRKIREFEVDDIFKILCEKIKHKVIYRAKDLRKLGKIFLRASANGQELYNFFSDPDMTLDELEQRTAQSGFSLHIEQAIHEIGEKVKDGIEFTRAEKDVLLELLGLLKKAI
jgi:ParB/RepB/Spo0J family partition protein